MNILSIDTSTSSMSVCIRCDDVILGEINLNNGLVHSTCLMPAIDNLFNIINFDKKNLDMIAVCVGPGSFTGIRIGVATANAFSMALNIPTVSVDSLYALALNFKYFDGTIISTIDAQRDNYYVGIYSCKDSNITQTQENTIMSDEELEEYVEKIDGKILLCGDAIEIIENKKIVYAKTTDNYIKSSNVSLFAQTISNDENNFATPVYMRKSQAEIAYDEKHSKQDII